MDELELISHNFSAITHREPNVAKVFYDRFFRKHPEVQELFTENPATQQQMLNETLAAVIDNLGQETWVASNMHSLGLRHQGYEVTAEMYDWWAETLLETLRDLSGADWSDALEEIWARQLASICTLARDATP